MKNNTLNLTQKQFEKLKKRFNSLKNYEEKLMFFESNFSQICRTNFAYSPMDLENLTESDSISIFPKLPEEREMYLNWIESKFPEYSFESRKTIFEEKLELTLDRNEFLKSIQQDVNKQIELIHGRNNPSHSSLYKGELMGYNEKVILTKIDYFDIETFNSIAKIVQIFKGRSLAMFKNHLEYVMNNQSTKNQKKSNEFTMMEKMLIVTLYQEIGMFPKFNPIKGQTKREFQQLIATITGADVSTIKEAFSKVDNLIELKDITSQSAPIKLRSLESIKQYFVSMQNSELIAKVDKLMRAIHSISRN